MKFITFEKHLREKGIELNPWQRIAAQRFLEVVRNHPEGGSGKSFLVKELAEFINKHGSQFDVDGDSFSEPIEGKVGQILSTMNNADAVKVWLDLRKDRGCFATPRTQGSIGDMEDQLYQGLTRRLVLESQECIFVDGGSDEQISKRR